MVTLNNALKLIFVLTGLMFLSLLLTEPKTDCEACEFEYDGDTIDGVEAYKLFREKCIKMDNPMQINISIINATIISYKA